MSFSWFFKASESTNTSVPTAEPKPETNLSKKTQDLIKELKESTKDSKPIDAKTVSTMSDETRLEKCKEIFVTPIHIFKARIIFEEYVALYGETTSAFSSISTYFGYKTNQIANKKAVAAIDPKSIRKNIMPKQIFEMLCKLKEIHKEVLDGNKRGETSDLIEALFLVYQLPIDDKEFAAIKQHMNEALPHLEIYNVIGSIPKVTLSLIDKCL